MMQVATPGVEPGFALKASFQTPSTYPSRGRRRDHERTAFTGGAHKNKMKNNYLKLSAWRY